MQLLRNYWLVFAAGTLALLVVGLLVDRQMSASIVGARWVSHAHEVLEALKTVEARLNNAESEQRAYVLLGRAEHLQRYYERSVPLAANLERVQVLVATEPEQAARALRLRAQVQKRRQRLDEVIAARQAQGAQAAAAMIATGAGAALMDQVRVLLAEMEDFERRQLQQRSAASERSGTVMRLVTPIGGSLAIVLLLAALALARRESALRLEAELVLRATHLELRATLARNEEIAGWREQLHRLSGMLQSCRDVAEAARIVERWMVAHAPGRAGALCLLDASEHRLQAVARWGPEPEPGAQQFGGDDCWAMRRGVLHAVADPAHGILCGHAPATADGAASLCLPLMAQGQPLGVLHLRPAPAQLDDADLLDHLGDLTAQLGLAVSNLRLQESLRTQSIRDPLTGLFNRRYLEASMQRELARAQRDQQELALLMLDADHFKRFNDNHGHDAGDAVLVEFGALLQQFCRAADVACRYGGEEFVLLLPDIGPDAALQRAQQLLAQIRALQVRVRKERVGGITASIGLALYPRHGSHPEQLIRAADQALYRAKNAGRDQVQVAEAN